MTHPGGRPRKLTPEQESRVYAEVMATRHGRRLFTYLSLARELGVGVSTLERVVTRIRLQDRFATPTLTSPFDRSPASGCISIADLRASQEFRGST